MNDKFISRLGGYRRPQTKKELLSARYDPYAPRDRDGTRLVYYSMIRRGYMDIADAIKLARKKKLISSITFASFIHIDGSDINNGIWEIDTAGGTAMMSQTLSMDKDPEIQAIIDDIRDERDNDWQAPGP